MTIFSLADVVLLVEEKWAQVGSRSTGKEEEHPDEKGHILVVA